MRTGLLFILLLSMLTLCLPAKTPLTPEQSLEKFQIAPGLRMELIASDPQIESPVAMAFDEEGKLWVVEMRDYPNGPAKGKPPEGRIKVLEDRNNDGKYEHSRIFADKLLFGNGLLLWNGGVIVTAAPYVLYLKDTDGDGKAEPPVRMEPETKNGRLVLNKSQILYEGFAAQNPQLRVSHPKLGLDGWIYVANGLRGGQAVRAGVKDFKPINLSGRDFRFDLINDRAEAISGMGQFGNCFDDWGHRFVCDNRHHLRHVVFPNRYLARNPLLAVRQVVEDISILEGGPLSSGGKVYPLSKNWTTSNLHAGRFTAACGVHIYQGDSLPKSMQGNAFTCDPTGNLVHREIMKQHGATFQSQPARKGVEFLATPDDWCRPVFLTDGPDGALYVVDMMRAVIEHPQFMPTELKNRPDLLLGKNKGRIWRIVPTHDNSKPHRPSLANASTKELVKLLEHPAGWWRTTAQRLLLTRRDEHAIEPLQQLLKESKSAKGRAHAVWLLESFDKLNESTLLHSLKDAHPRVREQAVQIAESRLPKSELIQKQLLSMAEDDDSQVRFRVALALGAWQNERILDSLTKIALRGSNDPWTRRAVASAVPNNAGTLFHRIVKSNHANKHVELLQELAELIGAKRDIQEVSKLIADLRVLPTLRLRLVESLVNGMQRRGLRLTSFIKQLSDSNKETHRQLQTFLKEANELAAKSSIDINRRESATRLLAHASWKDAKATLVQLFDRKTPKQLRLSAIQSLAQFYEPEVSKILMEGWRTYTPDIRRAVTDAMLRRPERIRLLFEEIKAKRVKPGDLDAVQTRRLLNYRDPKIRTQARTLLRESLPAERKAVLAKYRAALKLKGDPKMGRSVFEKNCATCHQVGDVGVNVGPVISDTRTKTPESLLVDILNPNQAIDNNYVNYVIETANGQSLNGIIIAETASSITLQQPENKTSVLLRADIDEMRSTGVSLMPEGLEKNIPLQSMADLLSYLKNWRYLEK